MPESVTVSARTKWLPVLSGLLVVVGFACGTSEPGAASRSPEATAPAPTQVQASPGLEVSNLVCQLDPPTMTATAVGAITNTLSFSVPLVTPVVTWLDADDESVSFRAGAEVAVIGSGEMVLFSIPSLMVNGMSACRIDMSGVPLIPVRGTVQARTVLTSELAR